MENRNRTKLFSRGNISIQLYNMDLDQEKYNPYSSLRFEWRKRVPFTSFSYAEFMEKARELIVLSKKLQGGEQTVEILGFSDNEPYLEALSSSGGQDDSRLNEILDSRLSHKLEDFSEEDYRKETSPSLFIRTPKKGDSFMVCLEAGQKSSTMLNLSNLKGVLSFYGQCLKTELFRELVNRYHRPGLGHSLSHPYTTDNPLNFVLCKLLPA